MEPVRNPLALRNANAQTLGIFWQAELRAGDKGMKILSTCFARKTKDGISDLEESVSDRCDLLTSQEADVIVYQMGWYTSSELGWGRTWTNISACQKRAICLCSQPMQSYTFHDRSLANGKSVPLWFDSMIVHYLQKKAGPTPGRRGGCRVRARQLAAAAAASGRPVTAFSGTVTSPFRRGA